MGITLKLVNGQMLTLTVIQTTNSKPSMDFQLNQILVENKTTLSQVKTVRVRVMTENGKPGQGKAAMANGSSKERAIGHTSG